MANFLSNLVGDDNMAAVIGNKAGEFVEDTVKKVLSQEEKKGGAKEKEKKEGDGFGIGDALSMVSGDKKEGEGLDVKNVMGSIFK